MRQEIDKMHLEKLNGHSRNIIEMGKQLAVIEDKIATMMSSAANTADLDTRLLKVEGMVKFCYWACKRMQEKKLIEDKGTTACRGFCDNIIVEPPQILAMLKNRNQLHQQLHHQQSLLCDTDMWFNLNQFPF